MTEIYKSGFLRKKEGQTALSDRRLALRRHTLRMTCFRGHHSNAEPATDICSSFEARFKRVRTLAVLWTGTGDKEAVSPSIDSPSPRLWCFANRLDVHR